MAQCELHSETQERVGSCETNIKNLRDELDEIKRTLKTINEKLDNRYPASVLTIMSLMSGTIGISVTALVTQMLK